MEFLPIGDAKLKIILSASDMKDYKLEASSDDLHKEIGRRELWRILDKARSEVGFDPNGDKILIQFYPTKGGGCEIFVTKLGILPDPSARLVAKSEKVAMLSKNRNFYCFETLADMAAVCKEIKRLSANSLAESDLYFDGAHFYLAMDEYISGGEPCEFPCIFEFAALATRERGIYLAEHGEILIKKDAVKVLSEL